MQALAVLGYQAAAVNTIHAQCRHPGRKAAGMAACCLFKHFVQVEVFIEVLFSAPHPVIKIAGDNQWLFFWDMGVDALAEH